MTTVNLEYAQVHLAELLDRAIKGEAFLVEREGKPAVKINVEATAAPPTVASRRIGFMEGQFTVPDDFKTRDQDEIIALFEGRE